eukprot:m.45325 g.45325  ORF g.45325 m.45325 type:complete len:669 (+) comp15123_c0_seq5:165-2171(+)
MPRKVVPISMATADPIDRYMDSLFHADDAIDAPPLEAAVRYSGFVHVDISEDVQPESQHIITYAAMFDKSRIKHTRAMHPLFARGIAGVLSLEITSDAVTAVSTTANSSRKCLLNFPLRRICTVGCARGDLYIIARRAQSQKYIFHKFRCIRGTVVAENIAFHLLRNTKGTYMPGSLTPTSSPKPRRSSPFSRRRRPGSAGSKHGVVVIATHSTVRSPPGSASRIASSPLRRQTSPQSQSLPSSPILPRSPLQATMQRHDDIPSYTADLESGAVECLDMNPTDDGDGFTSRSSSGMSSGVASGSSSPPPTSPHGSVLSGASSPVLDQAISHEDAVPMRVRSDSAKRQSLANRLSTEFGFGVDDTDLDFDVLETSQNADALSSALAQLHLQKLPSLQHDFGADCDGFISDAEDDPVTNTEGMDVRHTPHGLEESLELSPAADVMAGSERVPCALCALTEDHQGQMWMCMRNCTCQSHKSCLELWRHDCHNLCPCGAPISKMMLYSRYIGAVSVTDYDELHPDSPSNTDVVAAAARAVATQSRLSADPTTNTNPGCIVKMKITASYLRYEAVNFDMALTFKRYIMDAVRVERVDDMVIVLFLPEASMAHWLHHHTLRSESVAYHTSLTCICRMSHVYTYICRMSQFLHLCDVEVTGCICSLSFGKILKRC